MKKALVLLLVSVCCFNCSEKNEIDFTTLNKTEFNAKPFEMPDVRMMDSLKRAHDSCMGFAFNGNASLIQRRDSFFIGSIVNRRSLNLIATAGDLGITMPELFGNLNIITVPCYEKRDLPFPLKLVLGENFALHFPNVDEALNKEISDVISNAGEAEMQTGSWVYLDMKYALNKLLDTTTNPKLLRYKENLLDTSNMVLTAIESLTDVSYVINTGKDMPEPVQALLKSKPSESKGMMQSSVRLYYISSNQLQMTISGFFPIIGEFMKAELK